MRLGVLPRTEEGMGENASRSEVSVVKAREQEQVGSVLEAEDSMVVAAGAADSSSGL